MAELGSNGQAAPRWETSARTIGPDELGLITRDAVVSCGAETGVLTAWNEPGISPAVLGTWGVLGFEIRTAGAAARHPWFGRRLFRGAPRELGPIDPASDDSVGTAASGAILTHAAGAVVHPPAGLPVALCVGFAHAPRDGQIVLWKLERHAGLAALGRFDPHACMTLLRARHADGLTGLLNYAAIHAELAREVARAERHPQPLSCCFIDLDRFKRLNDHVGHLHGSAVLAEVAAALSATVRSGDIVGRYGGDEFVVILPNTRYDDACRMADRLRGKLAASVLPLVDRTLDASVGVAEWVAGQTPEELLADADEALRDAKRRGGATVVGARAL